MRNSGFSWPALLLAVLLVIFLGHGAFAATTEDLVDIDLSPLIDQAASKPTQFAVDVSHHISIANAGTWTKGTATSSWTYSVRIPTAVSLSFHASRLSLPPGAVLTVSDSSGTTVSYRARDIVRGGLWSRPMRGDSLLITLLVGRALQSQVDLRIDSLQAGYRGLGAGVPDNGHYRAIMRDATAASCIQNYACSATTANQGPANAIMALVVANLYQCTATLVNDTSGDAIPYVLTGRHCESGVLGGGDPSAAGNATVYWDATTPCGQTLGSIYDGTAIAQSGATTVIEQQDAWLIRLDSFPAASDAYFAGWDATGTVFTGGYSIHHALGLDKQFAGWYGQALLQSIPSSVLDVGYTSSFWGVVNGVGNVGAGASGGALFNPGNHLVGSASLAQLSNGANSDGVCPATNPQAPTASTVTAQYTALSGVWSSTSDTTSSTGSATLQSILDVTGTGQLVIGGQSLLPVTLSVSQTAANTGQSVTLTWSSSGAQSCTASGGLAGDGWAGLRGASGNYQFTDQTGGQGIYFIVCTGSNAAGNASVSVAWQLVPAVTNLNSSATQAAAGELVTLQWGSNTQPCTASGGTTGDGWSGTKSSLGSQNVLVSVLGTVTYSLTCGTGGRVATSPVSVTVVAPSAGTIYSDTNQMRVGQQVNLSFSGGGACVASGGGTGDGWAGPLKDVAEGGGWVGLMKSVTETSAGIYTYTVTCSGSGATAGLSSSSSTTLTFNGAAPGVSFTASPNPLEIYTDAGASNSELTLTWTSNVRPCAITFTGPGTLHGQVDGLDNGEPSGTALDGESIAGAYVYTITCGTGQSQALNTATVNYFTNQPAVSLSVSDPWPLGAPSGIGWSANVYPCTASGGTSGDGWAGAKTAAYGTQQLTEPTAGSVTFAMTCGSGAQTAQSQVTTSVIQPTVLITPSATTLAVNSPLTIRYVANFSPCSSSVSPGPSQGSGSILPSSGGFQTTQSVAGTYTYTIVCAGVSASAPVTFTGAATTLTASASPVSVNTPVALTWNSTGTSSCMGAGGLSGDGWSGPLPGLSGTRNVTSPSSVSVTYSIACLTAQGQSLAQAQVTYTPVEATSPPVATPTVTIAADQSTQVVGSPVTLTWSSAGATACAASGGDSTDGWSGVLGLSGTVSVTESSAGSFAYGITCTGAPPAAVATADVTFTAAAVTVTASTRSGKSGGGSLDEWSIIVLSLTLGRRLWGAGRRRHGATI